MGIIIKFANNNSSHSSPCKCNYCNSDAVDKVIKYILRKEDRKKADFYPGDFDIFGSVGTYHKSISGIIDDFKKIKRLNDQTEGVQIKHLIISFDKTPALTPKKMKKLVFRLLKFFSKDFQLVYAVHEDKEHLHIHVGINSVSIYGKKFSMNAEAKYLFQTKAKNKFFQKLLKST